MSLLQRHGFLVHPKMLFMPFYLIKDCIHLYVIDYGRREEQGLIYFMQSTISRVYSADLHPAARFGAGVYINAGGVVIGQTAVVGDDVTILQGVTLGGTGKERGDRHPKVGKGVVLNVGAIVLGNIPIGDFSIISAKSLVNKPVPPGALVSGIPGRVKGCRTLNVDDEELDSDFGGSSVSDILYTLESKIFPLMYLIMMLMLNSSSFSLLASIFDFPAHKSSTTELQFACTNARAVKQEKEGSTKSQNSASKGLDNQTGPSSHSI